jgi:hypothetical protein
MLHGPPFKRVLLVVQVEDKVDVLAPFRETMRNTRGGVMASKVPVKLVALLHIKIFLRSPDFRWN